MNVFGFSFLSFLCTLFVCCNLSFASAPKTKFYMTLHGSKSRIECQLITISEDQVSCRDSRAVVVHKYSAIKKITVFDGKETFEFGDELKTHKKELTQAINKMSLKKERSLEMLYERKQTLLAQQREKRLREREKMTQQTTHQGYAGSSGGSRSSATVVNQIQVNNVNLDRGRRRYDPELITKEDIQKERRIIDNKRRFAIEECMESSRPYKERTQCSKRVKKKFRKRMSELTTDPEQYFKRKRRGYYY